MSTVLASLALLSVSGAHKTQNQKQSPLQGPHDGLWYNSLPGDGGTQADSVFSGISTFGRIQYHPCLASDEVKYDIAFIGAPFDTGWLTIHNERNQYILKLGLQAHLTDPVPVLVHQALDKVLAASIFSMFKPDLVSLHDIWLSEGSRKVRFSGGYNVPLDANPFHNWSKLIDCGDIPVTSYDNAFAISQIEEGHHSILSRAPATAANEVGISKKGKTLPRVITLGGDHTITLPLLRSISREYGPITVIHFDSHLDTWKPKVFGGAPTLQASINHGTYFWHASEEGLLANDSSIHAGIRTTLSGLSDYENDGYCGFERVEAREIDLPANDSYAGGMTGIINRIKSRVGTTNPVYLSIDIDTIDPAFAPATGTPETGGWSTRELRTILRGLEGVNLIAADLVEVAPAYDTNAELTTMAAADVLYEVMTLMVKRGPLTKS